MKTFSYALVIMIALALAVSVLAGHLSLSPTGHVPISTSTTDVNIGFAIVFDISKIPADANIDLAELRIIISSDTTLSKSIDIVAYAATSSWISSGLSSSTAISKTDSLASSQFALNGESRWMEINVNHIVNLWHKGELANRGFYIEILGNNSKSLILNRDGSDWKAELSIYFSK